MWERFIGEARISRTGVCWVDYVLGRQAEHLGGGGGVLRKDELEPAGLAEMSPAAQPPGLPARMM